MLELIKQGSLTFPWAIIKKKGSIVIDIPSIEQTSKLQGQTKCKV